MNKLTEEQKQNIKQLREQGKTFSQISREVGVSRTAARYYSSDKEKEKMIKYSVEYFKNIPKEDKKRIYKRRLPYIRNFLNNKYKNDPEFREKLTIKKKERYLQSKTRHSV